MAYNRRNVADGNTVMNAYLYNNLQDGIDESKSSIEELDTNKANANDVYTKTEVDEKVNTTNTNITNLTKTLDNHTSNESNPHSVTATQIGLGNVNNTSDIDKPISTATQGAINNAITTSKEYTDTKVANLVGSAPETLDTLEEVAKAINDNEDVVSALNSAIGTKANNSDLTSHTSNTSNPHKVTASQVGLGNVNNTSDLDKPISTATQQALNGKSNTSHNHNSSYYTKTEINNKLSNLPTNAESTTYDNTTSGLTSTNVQGAIDELANKVEEYHAKVMTVVIDQSNSNPETCITYADDAVGMTPGSSEWDSFFGHYPCLFKNGVEVGRLNPNDFTKFEDGTSADITSGSAGDVMIAFPRLGYKISTSGDIVTVSMTDKHNAEGYCYLAHTRGTTVKDKFYLGAYKGYVTSNKLRSLSGKKPTGNTTIGNFRTQAQANGSGYDQSAFNQLIFRQCMYLLKYKNLDSQTAVGKGNTSGYAASKSTGGTDTKGMDYGTSSTVQQMKLFGIEDFWGNIYEFIDGIFIDSSYNILTATENFNNTGSGYTNRGTSGFSSDATGSGYMSKVQGTSEKGFVLKEKNGSQTTYYCDQAFVCASCLALFGGSWDTSSYAGAFGLRMVISASVRDSSFSARLMYL